MVCRKDLATGILRNGTHGGDGGAGAKKGRPAPNKGMPENKCSCILCKTEIGPSNINNHYQSNRCNLNQIFLPIIKIGRGRPGLLRGPDRIVSCPHCGNDGGIKNMHRWHFDNCKTLKNKGGECVQ